jgi:hypothetical protein
MSEKFRMISMSGSMVVEPRDVKNFSMLLSMFTST